MPIYPEPGGQAPAAEPDSARGHELARLFESHNRSLTSFLIARVGNEQEAQEVAQEAYARLLQLDRTNAISFLRAYLFKTASHIALDRARQRRARSLIDRALPAPESEDGRSPDRHLLAAEQLEIIEVALSELPANYRRAFIWRRVEDWTPERIAEQLGIQLRMVRNYISRATVYCRLRVEGHSAVDARRQALP